MNKDKIKWLYNQDKNRYHYTFWGRWKSDEEREKQLEETGFWNFPCIRRKSGFKRLLKHNDTCKEFGIKGCPIEDTDYLDPYQDERAMAWNERKSWKRNSKRKHQWKYK